MPTLYYIDLAIDFNLVIVSTLLLISGRGNNTSNRLLSVLLFFVAYTNLLISFYVVRKPLYTFPYLLGTHVPLELAIPPLMYFYFKSLFERSFIFKPFYLMYFIPSVAYLFKMLPFYFQTTGDKIRWISATPIGQRAHYILAVLFYTQFIIYIVLIERRLLHYSKQLDFDDGFAPIIRKWIREFMFIIILLLIVNVIPVFLEPRDLLLTPLLTFSVYFLIMVKIFFHPEVFVQLRTNRFAIQDNRRNRNGISTQYDLESLHNKLMDHVDHQKSYLAHDITLPELARQLDVPYHQLSRMINQKYRQNFNDFINSKRIEEAKKMLADSNFNNLTIDAIAGNVGFNSKASFYSAFRKNADCSPAEFKRKNS